MGLWRVFATTRGSYTVVASTAQTPRRACCMCNAPVRAACAAGCCARPLLRLAAPWRPSRPGKQHRHHQHLPQADSLPRCIHLGCPKVCSYVAQPGEFSTVNPGMLAPHAWAAALGLFPEQSVPPPHPVMRFLALACVPCPLQTIAVPLPPCEHRHLGSTPEQGLRCLCHSLSRDS